MTIRILHHLPEPSTPQADSWAHREAQLATAKVHSLLDDASGRLARLAGEVELPDELAAAVRETLRLVEAGRETIGIARNDTTCWPGATHEELATQRSPR